MSHNVQTSLVVTGQQGLPPFRAVSNSGLDAFAVGGDGYVYIYNVDVAPTSPTYSFLVLGNDGKVQYTSMFSTGGPNPGTSLDVVDYITGETFSSVSTMIFRGGVVSIPSTTATGVSVTGPAPVVTVWIPAPNYVGYFTPSLGSGAYTRYISNPSTNGYNSTPGNNGYYGTGTWDPATNFTASTTRNVTNSSGSLQLFSESEFACYNTGTTMSLYLYNHDGSILRSIVGHVINGTGATSQGGLTLNITSFSADNDRYKAAANGTVNVGNEFPNGGRFNWKVVHNNGDGAGNTTYGVYEYTQTTPVFYDNDGSSSSAKISGGVDFNELTPTTVQYSGVKFYALNSTFAFTASQIDLLNDITIPTTNQIDLTCYNLAVSGNYPGHTNGTKGAGSAITGWNLSWNKSGLTYSTTLTVNSGGLYIPGFSSNNTISSSPVSYVRGTIYDYGAVGYSQSVSRSMLFDTKTPGSVAYNDNPIDSENSRLSVSGVMTSGTSAFDSTLSLDTTNTDELQYIFGRVIYPQTNFTAFYPTFNWTANVNYSALSGANKSFTVYTDLDNAYTTSLSFNSYRWHVTSYTKGGSSFGGGYFTLTSNFTEAILHYRADTLVAGSADLVILIGIDGTGNSTTPDKFIFVSGDYNGPSPIYPGRDDASNYNFTGGTKRIKFTKGSGTPTVNKVWLFIGMKDSVAGKNIYLQNIHFT
jgi:hypothetical protein